MKSSEDIGTMLEQVTTNGQAFMDTDSWTAVGIRNLVHELLAAVGRMGHRLCANRNIRIEEWEARTEMDQDGVRGHGVGEQGLCPLGRHHTFYISLMRSRSTAGLSDRFSSNRQA